MGIRTFLLPGLDANADLRAEFVAALAPEFDASVLVYPNDLPLDYDGLVDWVRERLPTDEAFVLIAESFSGPVAIRLAAERPQGLIGLVLVATFVRCPRPGLSRLRFLSRWFPLHKPPLSTLTMRALMGRWSNPDWKRRLMDAISALDPAVLQRRLLAAATVDVAPQIADIECPILYLRASRDRVVHAEAWTAVRAKSRNAVCFEIDGPHMLLQARPAECAAAVKR